MESMAAAAGCTCGAARAAEDRHRRAKVEARGRFMLPFTTKSNQYITNQVRTLNEPSPSPPKKKAVDHSTAFVTK
jgi:hypothetical protein